jgi:hypothetical protein
MDTLLLQTLLAKLKQLQQLSAMSAGLSRMAAGAAPSPAAGSGGVQRGLRTVAGAAHTAASSSMFTLPASQVPQPPQQQQQQRRLSVTAPPFQYRPSHGMPAAAGAAASLSAPGQHFGGSTYNRQARQCSFLPFVHFVEACIINNAALSAGLLCFQQQMQWNHRPGCAP